MKLTDIQRDTMKLIKRSEHLADAEGWIKVNARLVSLLADSPDKLAETMEMDGDTFTRLTPAGQTVLEYL